MILKLEGHITYVSEDNTRAFLKYSPYDNNTSREKMERYIEANSDRRFSRRDDGIYIKISKDIREGIKDYFGPEIVVYVTPQKYNLRLSGDEILSGISMRLTNIKKKL